MQVSLETEKNCADKTGDTDTDPGQTPGPGEQTRGHTEHSWNRIPTQLEA